jgi:inner membrane protein
MASSISHAVAALGIGACFYKSGAPRRIFVVGALCSVIPDLDVIGFRFGIPYADFWGHRGFTHSLLFAALVAATVTLLISPRGMLQLSGLSLYLYFFLVTASHGLLDAMTNGGLGVAFFSPFNNRRYFLPWTPIHVSPIGITRFFTHRGLAILQTEIIWIWLPASALATVAYFLRSRTHTQDNPE